MVNDFSIQGKIIIIVFILFIPILLVSTIDPIPDESAMCIDDICFEAGQIIENRCFPKDSSTCIYELKQMGNQVFLLDQEDRWLIQGDAVVCERFPQILQTECENVAIFPKDDYSLRQMTVFTKEVQVFSLK